MQLHDRLTGNQNHWLWKSRRTRTKQQTNTAAVLHESSLVCFPCALAQASRNKTLCYEIKNKQPTLWHILVCYATSDKNFRCYATSDKNVRPDIAPTLCLRFRIIWVFKHLHMHKFVRCSTFHCKSIDIF